MKEKGSSFSGSIGFVLAAAGSAVGVEISGDFHISVPKMAEDFSCWFIWYWY